MSVIALLLVLSAQQLPEPFETDWNRAFPSIVERPADVTLSVPAGFEVSVFADGLSNPRHMALAPNGDVFVAESRSGEILLLRDADGDGVAERRETFATALERPFGMAFLDGFLYVGNNDAVVRFPYVPGQLRAQGVPEHVVDLPVESDALDIETAERLGIDVSRTRAERLGIDDSRVEQIERSDHPTRGFRHWTRNLIFGPDGRKMYVAVGSSTNAKPGTDPRRAAISEYNADGSGHRVFAGGLRNPVAMAFYPESSTLWTVVHERDHLGDELAPDFVTSVVDGGFYGWPYAYIGPNPEPAPQRSAAGSCREDDRSRCAPPRPRGPDGIGLLHRRAVSRNVPPQRVRCAARVRQPPVSRRVLGRAHPVRERKAVGPAGGLFDRIHRQGRRNTFFVLFLFPRSREGGVGSPGRCTAVRGRLTAGRRRRGQSDLPCLVQR